MMGSMKGGQRALEELLREKQKRQERQAREIAAGRQPLLLRGAKPVLVGNKNGW